MHRLGTAGDDFGFEWRLLEVRVLDDENNLRSARTAQKKHRLHSLSERLNFDVPSDASTGRRRSCIRQICGRCGMTGTDVPTNRGKSDQALVDPRKLAKPRS